ncbi:MAG TPA: hypothetical protein VGI50_10315, partial [Solirubrobacteraceae bacterium]
MVPRTDFDVISHRLGARVFSPGAAVRPLARAENAIRLDVSQAARARRTRASVYLSMSERVGIPLSLLRPR